jgi:hypothetical protein
MYGPEVDGIKNTYKAISSIFSGVGSDVLLGRTKPLIFRYLGFDEVPGNFVVEPKPITFDLQPFIHIFRFVFLMVRLFRIKFYAQFENFNQRRKNDNHLKWGYRFRK